MNDDIKRGPGRPPINREPIRAAVHNSAHDEWRARSATRVRTLSIDDLNNSRFNVPPELIPDGISLQWITKTVAGKEDNFRMLDFMRNGWEPVPSKLMPGMMPEGTNPNAPVERDGLVLVERPKELTLQSERELERAAHIQKRSAIERAGQTPVGHIERKSSITEEVVDPRRLAIHK